MGRREVRDLMEQLRRDGKTIFFSTHILSDAETVCDRVAILHQGELRSVGKIGELTAGMLGRVELVWRGNAVPAAFKNFGGECHARGETIRAVIPEQHQDAALEILGRERLRLISLTPVRASLEEYYLQKLQPAQAYQSAGGRS